MEREVLFMKKDKIIKIVMSAAFMATVTTLPAWAEGMEAETTEENTELVESEEGLSNETEDGTDMEENNWQLHSNQEYGPHANQDIVVRWLSDTETQIEQPPESEETSSTYTERDLYILAHAICGEGQSCPDDEQLYIGSVILNRINHGAYPNTIEGVVFQRGQYACTRDGNYYREPTEANWRNAKWLLENGSILPSNVVYQAGFRQGSGIYMQTRYHKYCYR